MFSKKRKAPEGAKMSRDEQIQKVREVVSGQKPQSRPTGRTIPLPQRAVVAPSGQVVVSADEARIRKAPGFVIPQPEKSAERLVTGERAMLISGTYGGEFPEIEPRKVAGLVGWGTVVAVDANPMDDTLPAVVRKSGFDLMMLGSEAYNNYARKETGGFKDGGPIGPDGILWIAAILLDTPAKWGYGHTLPDDPKHPFRARLSEEDERDIVSQPPVMLAYEGMNGMIIQQSEVEEYGKKYEILPEREFHAIVEKVQAHELAQERAGRIDTIAGMLCVDADVVAEVLKEAGL